jgi:hypothetical protein
MQCNLTATVLELPRCRARRLDATSLQKPALNKRAISVAVLILKDAFEATIRGPTTSTTSD